MIAGGRWALGAVMALGLLAGSMQTGRTEDEASPGTGQTAEQALAALKSGAISHLEAALADIPGRWDKLPSPRIKPSGRKVEDVLNGASKAQAERAMALYGLLIVAPPAKHREVIAQVDTDRSLDELDLWLCGLLAQQMTVNDRELGALAVRAWLSIAEYVARKDVLLMAASSGLQLARLRLPLARALPLAKAWASLTTPAGSERGAAGVVAEYAQLLYYDGQQSEALRAQARARALYKHAGDKLGEANTWVNEGEVRFRLGENQRALSAYQKARPLFLAVGSKLGEANTWVNEGQVRFLLGENQLALSAYQKARPLFLAVGSKLGEASTWDNIAKLQSHEGRPQAAERSARKALALAPGHKILPNEISAHLTLMRSLTAQGREAEAIAQAETALLRIDAWRQRAATERDRAHKYDTSAPYDLLVPRLARQPRQVMRALAHAETAHAPVLRDVLASNTNSDRARPAQAVPDDMSRRLGELQRLLVALDDDLAQARSARRSHLLERRRAVDGELETLLVAMTAYTGEHLGQSKPITERARRKLVDASGPVLLYYVAERETVAFLLLPGQRRPRVKIIGLGRAELIRQIHDLRHHLSNPLLRDSAAADQLARRLYDRLLRPLFVHIKGKDARAGRLTIIPHGPLHQLPFAALRERRVDNPDRLLVDRWHLTVAPSLSVLNAVRARSAARTGKPARRFVGLATRANLRHAAAEVREVGEMLGAAEGDILDGSPGREAMFARYKKLAGSARYLFLSTHGYQVPGSRSGTYLEIVRSAVHDSRLSIREIATIPLRAELVALSACDTAAGEAMLSDERLDLARAFLIAGADSVLATHWKVPDTPDTGRFIRDFFHGLHKLGLPRDQALSHAQRKAIKAGVDARVWAAWVLVGSRGTAVRR